MATFGAFVLGYQPGNNEDDQTIFLVFYFNSSTFETLRGIL